MKEVATVNGDAPIYNLKAVVMETGLKPPTIRAWERRYGLPQPHRTSGGHRQYSQRDIETLKWLVARQQEGVSISHAVELWESLIEQGKDPLLPLKRVPATQVTPIAPQLGTGLADLREAWIAACLAYDRGRAEQILAQAFALFTPEIVCI
jgi:DNA-binding transcriptional MerR regulator